VKGAARRWVWPAVAIATAAIAIGVQFAYARAHRRPVSLAVLARETTIERAAMSTLWRVVLPRGARAVAVDVAERALDEVARLENVLSEWRPQTELSRVNANSGGAPVRVGADTWAVVERSLQFARMSDGAFDPTWAALRGLWDFRHAGARPPDPAAIRERLPLVNWRGVEMDARAQTIRLARPGMALGLGGIAKGYALDRMRTMLHDAGVRDFMLYAGGQVLVSGTRNGRAWRVGVQHPRDPNALLGTVSVTSGSVSTGGDYEHYFEHGGRRYHHILDPRTGMPVEHTIAVTVVARTGIDADGFDTALFVLPPDRALALAESLGVALIRTGPDLRSELSSPMRAMLELRTPLDGVARGPTP